MKLSEDFESLPVNIEFRSNNYLNYNSTFIDLGNIDFKNQSEL